MKRRNFIFKKFILPKALKYQIHFYTFFHMHFLISPPIITVWAQTLLSGPLDYWNNIKNSLLHAKISLSKSLSGFGTLFQMALYFLASMSSLRFSNYSDAWKPLPHSHMCYSKYWIISHHLDQIPTLWTIPKFYYLELVSFLSYFPSKTFLYLYYCSCINLIQVVCHLWVTQNI